MITIVQLNFEISLHSNRRYVLHYFHSYIVYDRDL